MNPIIIAHNCGYKGYGVKCYSKEATENAYKDCDYLEIDLKSGKKEGNNEKEWFYRHDRISGGKEFEKFLGEFNDVAKKISKPKKTGLFLDLKEHLKHQKDVDDFMDYLDHKYKCEMIPAGTPLMIYTGRGYIPYLHAVYRHTTLYFLKWLYKNRKKSHILDPEYCPKLTIVTREVKPKELVEGKLLIDPSKMKALDEEEQRWFEAIWNEKLNRKFWWAFNPYPAWFFKYNFDHVFENGITMICWFSDYIDWQFKRLGKWDEGEKGWMNAINTVFKKYVSYMSKNSNTKKTLPEPSWGIISYKPNKLKDFLKKVSS